jgi:flagellar export protein FliJ
MARFLFRFAPVLRQRELAERDAQTAMAQVERERLACQDRILALQQQYAAERNATRSILTFSVIPSDDLRLQAAASHAIIRRIEHEAVALSGIAARHEKARRHLAHAAMRRRAMEILRDRAHEAWKHEQFRREAMITDDIVTAMASRSEHEA